MRRRESAAGSRCRASAALLVLLLSGCIQNIGPSLSERSPEELGAYPKDYRAIVERWIDDNLVNISTIESLRVSPPTPGFSDGPLRSRRYGWWSRVDIRARDRLGMLKGRMVYALLIYEGRVVSSQKRID